MTVTLDRPSPLLPEPQPSPPSLPEALGIPGARSVSLLDPDGAAVLWSAGAGEPGPRQAAAVVSLATAAIALAGPVDDLGDIILTSTETFHVIRLVGDGTGCVAHLTLLRTGANLAMARRDFRVAVAGYAARPRHAAGPVALPQAARLEPAHPEPAQSLPAPPEPAQSLPAPPEPAQSLPAPPEPVEAEPVTAELVDAVLARAELIRDELAAAELAAGELVPVESGVVRPAPPVLVKPVPPGTPEESPRDLPRRERSEPPGGTEEIADPPADWFTSLIQAPFANDESVLDRILVTLRAL